MAITRKCSRGMRYRKTYLRKIAGKTRRRIRGACIRSQTRSAESSAEKVHRLRGRMTRRLRGIPMTRRGAKTCKAGKIRREAYVRVTRRGKRVLVPASCIRDLGAPGKGLKGGPGIGPLRKGELAQFGYVNVSKLSAEKRRNALRKAVAAFGSLTVWRKLNAVAVYTHRTSPSVSALFKADMDWIKATFGLKAF
jgi:hypothetical protein